VLCDSHFAEATRTALNAAGRRAARATSAAKRGGTGSFRAICVSTLAGFTRLSDSQTAGRPAKVPGLFDRTRAWFKRTGHGCTPRAFPGLSSGFDPDLAGGFSLVSAALRHLGNLVNSSYRPALTLEGKSWRSIRAASLLSDESASSRNCGG
jgi:hypothetical protein